jgi:hypothetical protein
MTSKISDVALFCMGNLGSRNWNIIVASKSYSESPVYG